MALRPETRRKKNHQTYGDRDAILVELGFTSYGDYLKSHLWDKIRTIVLIRNGWKCWVCHSKANQVHHQHYSKGNLSGESKDGMVALCRKCHEKAEVSTDGGPKATLGQANNKLQRMKTYRDPALRAKRQAMLAKKAARRAKRMKAS